MKTKKLKQLIFSLLVLAAVLSCASIPSLAASDVSAIEPRWASIYHMEVGMSFSGSDGNVTGIASKQSTSNFIEGTLYLYKLVDNEWVYMDEWYKSKAIGTLGISGDFVCESGVTYKGVFTVTAYTDGVPETETIEYSETCP